MTLFITEADLAWMREHTGPGKPVSRADVLRWGIRENKYGIREALARIVNSVTDDHDCAICGNAANHEDYCPVPQCEDALTETGG